MRHRIGGGQRLRAPNHGQPLVEPADQAVDFRQIAQLPGLAGAAGKRLLHQRGRFDATVALERDVALQVQRFAVAGGHCQDMREKALGGVVARSFDILAGDGQQLAQRDRHRSLRQPGLRLRCGLEHCHIARLCRAHATRRD